ncbi:hypothetical protein QNI19_03485 [Cytophagaceae bacterium DM2B3-1]|uniref:DKNYY family protein n=1 Tax=Xanthocytophaga flava TaxID=3048013 RepID=A0ABT7CE59_9BACT|nr:hypothetical protein [Xanthocytophaga flavus]MDJ1473123.1 hypothetical protein [Xanthocytophaga flavus]MDJ1491980.1 hypothetical protein [Xanthocytophaga flavus]
MKRIFTLLFILGVFFNSKAQVKQVQRTEIQLESKDENYHLIPIGKEGLMIFKEGESISRSDDKNWEFIQYDNNFQKSWETTVAIDEDLFFSRYYYDELSVAPKIYILFNRYKSAKKELLVVDILTKKTVRKTFETPKKFSIQSFKAYNDAVYFMGTIKKSQVIGYYDIQKEGFLQIGVEKGEVLKDIQVRNREGLVDITSLVNHNKKQGIKLNSFYKNERKSSLTIHPEDSDKEKLLDARMTVVNDEKIIAGTYTTSTFAQGLYISRVTSDKTDYIKYYSFTEFANFFKFLSEKGQEKMEKKIEKKKAKGEDLKVNCRLLLHDLILQDNQYILLGEAYVPTYRTEYQTRYVNGRAMTYTTRVFDGYLYTHAVVAGFDKQGKLLWDNCFEMGDVKQYSLKHMIRVNVENQIVKLIYSYNDHIFTKVVKGNNVVDDKNREEMDKKYEGDKHRAATRSSTAYWYDNYFLAWGDQRIKNKEDKKVDRKRSVFYFEKIEY